MKVQNGDTVWVCGQIVPGTEAGWAWEFVGVFLTEDDAVAACRTPHYFIGPTTIGHAQPPETVEWEGAYYPLAGNEAA